jgi:5-methylcytosine-specific restriction endonuclease McrA
MANPEIARVEYQHGTLWGYKLRMSLLKKYGQQRVYWGSKEGKLEVDHLVPRARGGSNRPSDLVIAGASGNQMKTA